MWTYNSVKQAFIDYFVKRGHIFVPGSSLIPTDDNSLLFTNSGMVQFKSIFLGKKIPDNLLVVNSQKCVRAGGKHNDLDDVGSDSYHHTFFEMLGNWSFNYDGTSTSYFKEQAIHMAFDLLMNTFKLDPKRIYVTYFAGHDILDTDEETKQIWSKYLPTDHILPFGCKENFWEMGDIGPCGPCTEIHYDLLGNRYVPELVNADDPTLIEIWNLVFMQYQRHPDGSLTSLNMRHVDTGAGLERLVAVLQGCTNYEIDLFKRIISVIKEESPEAPDYTNKYGIHDPEYIDTSYRVVADHFRTMIMLINEGVVPGPSDQRYVLRRIIRRALRYGTKLKIETLSGLVMKVMELLETEYGETFGDKNAIVNIVRDEEIKFGKTMRKGISYFNKLLKQNELTADNIFKLYTTFGFPIDIIKQLCTENNIVVDIQRYQELMTDHVVQSKQGKKFS
jgi:alanyl-tRNA synthetase